MPAMPAAGPVSSLAFARNDGSRSALARVCAALTAVRNSLPGAWGRPFATRGHAVREAATSRFTAPSRLPNWLDACSNCVRWSASSRLFCACEDEPDPQPAISTAAPISMERARLQNRTLAPRVPAARGALLRKKLVLGAMGSRSVLDAEQVHHKYERRVRRDRGR